MHQKNWKRLNSFSPAFFTLPLPLLFLSAMANSDKYIPGGQNSGYVFVNQSGKQTGPAALVKADSGALIPMAILAAVALAVGTVLFLVSESHAKSGENFMALLLKNLFIGFYLCFPLVIVGFFISLGGATCVVPSGIVMAGGWLAYLWRQADPDAEYKKKFQPLLNKLASKYENTRVAAVKETAKLMSSSPEIVMALTIATNDEYGTVRCAAEEALKAPAHQAVLGEHPELQHK